MGSPRLTTLRKLYVTPPGDSTSNPATRTVLGFVVCTLKICVILGTARQLFLTGFLEYEYVPIVYEYSTYTGYEYSYC